MPLSPSRRRIRDRISFRVFPFPFFRQRMLRFGRKKDPLKPAGFVMPSWRTMSRATVRVAVAVRASTGTPRASFRPRRRR